MVGHGGVCGPGEIYDHNKNSPTYGQCIPIVRKTPTKKANVTDAERKAARKLGQK